MKRFYAQRKQKHWKRAALSSKCLLLKRENKNIEKRAAQSSKCLLLKSDLGEEREHLGEHHLLLVDVHLELNDPVLRSVETYITLIKRNVSAILSDEVLLHVREGTRGLRDVVKVRDEDLREPALNEWLPGNWVERQVSEFDLQEKWMRS